MKIDPKAIDRLKRRFDRMYSDMAFGPSDAQAFHAIDLWAAAEARRGKAKR